ncbi:TPA: transcription-repair coupling factor [Candidatus Poribacteria bacterium]|nr:transcription-repair coupling factor [Candidatus Poribacteria bacterium]HIB86375.1 transcription-repair coupling factor [Candidatus Poribacteria bacterium]HIC17471.1 transcription-repair coupling factor [Candidatus Poribacteria bacterium]HIM11359.1 transcription-repair coupling factor [Candidatus Poribacteria bacterium]HIN29523.1 transcription-repair coupling factor [Candidatus Poribacteria bacterium]
MKELFRQTQSYQSIISSLSSKNIKPWIRGLHGSSTAYLLGSLAQDLVKQSFIAIFPSQSDAEKLVQDLSNDINVSVFPECHNFLYQGISPPKKHIADRMECFENLMSGKPTFISTSIKALLQKVPPKPVINSYFRTVKIGQEIDLSEITAYLIDSGYGKVELVEAKGDFARRGNILDIYPLNYDQPIRIDLFGDEVDDIRLFDSNTQRSNKNLDRVTLTPVREIISTDEIIDQWRKRSDTLISSKSSPKYTFEIEQITYRLEEGKDLEGLESIIPMLHSHMSTLLDYVPPDTLVTLVEPSWVEREAKQLIEQAEQIYQKKWDSNQFMVPPDETFMPLDSLISKLEELRTIHTSSTPPPTSFANQIEEIQFGMLPLGLQRGNYQMNFEKIKKWAEDGYTITILCENQKLSQRFGQILNERNFPDLRTHVRTGNLSEGFISEDEKIVVMSDHEVFGRAYRPTKKPKFKDGVPISSIIDLQVDDFVVHVSHGIAVYRGIKKIEVDGKLQDFIKLEYAASDILYVPTYQINLVQKFIGGDEKDYKPKIDRLGGTAWKKTKSKAQAAIENMAEELLSIYAKRKSTEGFAFPSDSPWQQEFEALFSFEETPDQIESISDVKSDMEQSQPMDRLICGDVGYGKTEVALRAAFKAVEAGKQVAVLVPTTVLALQHFNTFQHRFNPFPICVEMLSRFRTPKQMQTTKSGMTKGTVDIVIGTHALISDTIKFNDLGLLIIDEEHRFGVKHKEKIKQIRSTVDVLTLTATPIPRTLHMSMVGIRDFSLINTPPENRLPIETYIMEYNPDIIQESILREVERGGQAFFVHNRVQSIASIATHLGELLPQVRIAVSHGQMPERQLEKVITDFMDHKYDVLVSTMIIESGVDIPNVNTIIINRADVLGLAQLYQLRGRVGRADLQAYGYLFYPQGQAVTEGAQKRLRVIEEFTDLGSGFKIALRDLEIRGAGNMLGPQQYGHIATIGYDLYCQLLEEAIQKLKGEEIEEKIDVRIDLPLEAYLPDNYIPDSRQKISFYKKIANLKTTEGREELEVELQDRFGTIPESVNILLDIAELKHNCQEVGVERISTGEEKIKITFNQERTSVNPQKVIVLIQQDKRISLIPPSQLQIDSRGLSGRNLVLVIRSILNKLQNS